MRSHSELSFFGFSYFVIGVMCAVILSCTPAQIDSLKRSAWSSVDCGLHSSLGCAGQAAGACTLSNFQQDDFNGYATCLASAAQSCMTSSLARCALAGMASVVSGPIVAGGAGCGDEEARDQVTECVTSSQVSNEAEAVHVAAECWRSVCGF